MRDISRASGVSQPLIHHYFKTKRDLYNQIKRQMILRFDGFWTDTVNQVADGDYLPDFVLRRIFEFMKDNPTVLRVGAWSQLEGDNAPWPGELKALERVSQFFSAAQADGIMRSDLNPTLLTILVEGFMFSWWEYRDNFWRLYEGRPEGEHLDEKVLGGDDRSFFKGNVSRTSPRGWPIEIFVGCGQKKRAPSKLDLTAVDKHLHDF